jgi:hypothetical protein
VDLLEVLNNVGGAVHHFGVVGLAGEMALSAEPELSMCDEVILEVSQLNTILPERSYLTLAFELTLMPHFVGQPRRREPLTSAVYVLEIHRKPTFMTENSPSGSL